MRNSHTFLVPPILKKIKQTLDRDFTPHALKVLLGFILAAAVLSYFCNIYIFQEEEPIEISASGWLASSFLTAFILALCTKWKLLGYILLPLITLITAGAFYLHAVFDTFISYTSISVLLETDMREASDYISLLTISCVLGLLFITFLSIHLAHRSFGKQIRSIHLLGLFLLFSISADIATSYTNSKTEWYKDRDYMVLGYLSPLTDIYLLQKHIREYRRSDKGQIYAKIMQLPSMSDVESTCSLAPEDNLTLVLHIGESVRGDHLNFNGYKRETMPRISKRLKNIVSFPKHYSYGVQTRISIIGMLTMAEIATRNTQYRPFFDLFNKHGFYTHFLMDIPNWDYDAPMQILSSSCKEQTIASQGFSSPHYYFEYMVNEFKNINKENPGKSLIMLQDLGAHHMFQSLEKNKKWLPDTFNLHQPLRDLKALTNAYDNNILEIDIEIDSIIQEIEDQVALYIHVSDHGIALGEHRQWGRHADETTMMPALFIWMSDSFIKKYPEIHASLSHNASKTVSHDHLLHTILSLGGIRSQLQKKELDLTHPDAKEYIPVDNPGKTLEIPLNPKKAKGTQE